MFNRNLINNNIDCNSKFLKTSKKFFRILTPEEYIVNMTESIRRTNVESCKLRPLPEASKYK